MPDDPKLSEILPDGYIPLSWAVTMKALDEEGNLCLYTTRSSDLTAWECAGMLLSALDDTRALLRSPGDM